MVYLFWEWLGYCSGNSPIWLHGCTKEWWHALFCCHMKTSLCRIRPHVLGTILLKGPFNPPQTLNGQIKKGTNSLIRLIGVTTAKWLQNGAALLFLSNTPSLIQVINVDWG